MIYNVKIKCVLQETLSSINKLKFGSLCINVHKCIRLKRTTLNKAYTDNNRQNAESYIQQFLLCEKDNSVELILKYMSTYLTLSENFQI